MQQLRSRNSGAVAPGEEDVLKGTQVERADSLKIPLAHAADNGGPPWPVPPTPVPGASPPGPRARGASQRQAVQARGRRPPSGTWERVVPPRYPVRSQPRGLRREGTAPSTSPQSDGGGRAGSPPPPRVAASPGRPTLTSTPPAPLPSPGPGR